MNEEWKSMFGSQEPPASQASTVTVTAASGGFPPTSPSERPACVQVSDGPAAALVRKSAAAPPALGSLGAGPAYQRRINTCRAELQQLVQQKREQCSAERMAKHMMESAEWESRPPPPGSSRTRLHVHGRRHAPTHRPVWQGGTPRACWSPTSTSTKPPSTASACLTSTPSSPRRPATAR